MSETLAGVDVGSLNSLYSAVNQLEEGSAAYTDSVRIAFLRNITIEGVDAFLKYHLYTSGIRPEITVGGYGTMIQDVVAEDSLVARTDPDLVVIALTLEELDPAYGAPGWRSDSIRLELERLFETIAERTRATIAVNTFLPPLHSELGIALSPDSSDLTAQVASLNRFVVEFVRARGARFCLTDWERYLRLLGSDGALDYRYWYLAKAPFRKAFLNCYAQELARVARALKGKARKCLVLDCDNTLWGGVVGEDGLSGLKLDTNQYPGRAYYDFQTAVLHLAERGILIALCSKNNEADVFEVLDNHPACRLKRSHLAAWRINWRDKATNIAEMAEELNLGLDAFVFVDDNPTECDLVAQVLPQVAVLRVPEKLYQLPQLIFRDGLFDTLRLTGEDKRRSELYRSDAERKMTRGAFASLDDYLASLQTVAVIRRARAEEVPRVAQLSQKTNQFNLTTRRYSEEDIRRLIADEDAAVFIVSAKDRFGDLGLVGVLIAMRDAGVASIDTFFMSCRALGRGIESAMAIHCISILNALWGRPNWRAEYLPTRKNMQVADFWPTVGFLPTESIGEQKIYAASASELRVDTPVHVAIRQD